MLMGTLALNHHNLYLFSWLSNPLLSATKPAAFRMNSPTFETDPQQYRSLNGPVGPRIELTTLHPEMWTEARLSVDGISHSTNGGDTEYLTVNVSAGLDIVSEQRLLYREKEYYVTATGEEGSAQINTTDCLTTG